MVRSRGWGLAGLPWLPGAPPDLRARVAAMDVMVADKGPALSALARYALDLNGLTRLGRVAAKAIAASERLDPLTPYRLGVVGNATLDLLLPCLVASALRHQVALDVVAADFGQAEQAALDTGSKINVFRPKAVLIALDYHALGFRPEFDGGRAAEVAVGTALKGVDAMRRGFKSAGAAAIVLQTVPPPPDPLFGSLDACLHGSVRRQIVRFNAELVELAATDSDMVLDVDGLAASVGLEHWHDPVLWHHAKLAFSSDLVPLYTEHVARLIGAATGKSRKCLVLDLDNTVWGGVIGDDGLEGIVLGHGDAVGEAFLEIQRMALALRDRGILLAVCSKNDENIARAAFREHPEMLLKEEHIAVFQANWHDKASNLEAIAKTLNIGIDALVLLDDNPAERAQVRGALPEVAVPELPEDPSLYPRTLLAAGYFEAVSFTVEDRQRAGQYAAEAQRASTALTYRDLDEFLRSLDMAATIGPFDAIGLKRIVQLINKTNQFNLTTRRYSEAEIAGLTQNRAVFTMQVRLADRFGDNGMISAVICHARGQEWIIESWVMSCRVLNRRVEELMCDELAAEAGRRGGTALIGRYIATARNKLAEAHYERLGFSAMSEQNGATDWRLDLKRFVARQPPIKVRRPADDVAAAAE